MRDAYKSQDESKEVEYVSRGHAQKTLPAGTTYSVLRCQQLVVLWNLSKQMSMTSFRIVFAICNTL